MSSEWKANRDALIEETMAFVASVSQHTSSADGNTTPGHFEDQGRPVVEVDQQQQPKKFIDSERAAIRRRVANFKAHQGRLIQEREAFANATLKTIQPSNNR